MRRWIAILTALIVVALLAGLAYMLIGGVTRIAGNADFGAGEPDPMFSAPPETVTRPPELDAEEASPQHQTLDDYVPEVETPVDKTAAQLIEEAKQSRNN